MTTRPPMVLHCTSEPYRFFGRTAELALLDDAFTGGPASVIAFVGPGGQGKTAIAQHWLQTVGGRRADGVFLWSFYRGKDADLCLRHLLAYAEGMSHPPDVSASYCVDHLLPLLRRERWAVVLDGLEVVQHEAGDWFGRVVHPELGRLLQELAMEPLPGVVLVTSRFPLLELERRKHARLISLAGLDVESGRGLLRTLGVGGEDADLDEAAASAGLHAKAVELLGTFLARFHDGEARRFRELPSVRAEEGSTEEERDVARVLAAFQEKLPAESQDVVALTMAFREPAPERDVISYLHSDPVQALLEAWRREYVPFARRPRDEVGALIQELVGLRLLERVHGPGGIVIDAHPLVRRGFEHVLGPAGRRASATARAGFLRGRPDRQRPPSLEQAREEVELFHSYCDAGLWDEADGVLVGLDNPKHRFLAPALELELLLRFFPERDWRRPPLWPGFGRYRSLAIALELLGRFEEALDAYRGPDAPLRGDALIALGRLEPLINQPHAASPWQTLWQAYRAHALCLAGRTAEGVAVALALVPVDVYEWIHVFECLRRARRLDAMDLRSVLYRPPHQIGDGIEQRWSDLARRRMRAEYRRVVDGPEDELGAEYLALIEEYDRAGLPFERCLTRLGYARWLLDRGESAAAREVVGSVREVARRYGMAPTEADAAALEHLVDSPSRRLHNAGW